MRLLEVFGVLYFSAIYAAQDLHDATAMADTGAPPTIPQPMSTVIPTVYVPPVPSLQLQSTWSDVFLSEKVVFNCSVSGSSDWTFTWSRDGKEVQDSDPNVSLSPGGSELTITVAAQTYSGKYSCKGHHKTKGVTTAASDALALTVYDPPKPSLALMSPWNNVFENEIVLFSCKAQGSDWTTTIWYKNQMKLQEDDILTIGTEGEQLLNISVVTKTHEGGYACKVQHHSRDVTTGFSNTVNLNVYENLPKPTLIKDPVLNSMYVGETVKFTCNVDVSTGWVYQWYKGEDYLNEINKTINIRLDASDHGTYSCVASRAEGKTITDNSNEIEQNVLEIPVPSLNLLTPWSDIFPGESVKMSCALTGSVWIYTWYKDGQEVQANSVVSFDSNRETLYIKSASAEHAGQYTCKGDLSGRSVTSSSSPGFTLTVYDKSPSVTLKQDPEYNLMFSGESVSFSCHINVSSGWEYQWYKDGKLLEFSGNKYTISSVETGNQQLYKCEAKRGTNPDVITYLSQAIRLDVKGNKPKPSTNQVPAFDKVYIGESVSLQCKVELSSGWQYLWYKNDELLPIKNSSLDINNTNLLNNGIYKCMAERIKTMYKTIQSDGWNLSISEIPVPSLKEVTPWLDVFPTERVELSCEMKDSSNWEYTWYRAGQKIQADNAVSFGVDRATLSISSASASHRGQYSCSGKLKHRSVVSNVSHTLTLHVYDTKPRVMLVQNPEYDVMHTGDSVSFSCHINVSTGWEYQWYKDESALAESRNNYTIPSVLTKNTGLYKCQTKRGSNTVFRSESQALTLNIEERPKAIIDLLTGWSEVFSTDSLVLQCWVENSPDMWNYTWFKEDKPIDLAPSERYIVTPEDDPEQSLYTCKGIRNGRPSYSKESHHFKTKNLLLKRRLLLSISGCIFFGIIAVFLGCIFLRVFRKPANNEYKPEEADLFLSMKRGDDSPCPLVEYITDAALNSPPKEGDENGTICSDTTPLPISSQEDQAATPESQDTTENSGGLVSFKQ